MKIFLAALTLLVALAAGSWSYDVCGVRSNPGEVQGMAGNPAYFDCSKDDRCKGYVVLVTFVDKTWGWYETDDQPYGYSWDLFNQFFNGGYDGLADYEGTTALPRQATDTDPQEAVFGSVRAYFDEVHGDDIIEFELLNKKNTDGSPMWLVLPKTKYEYATLSGGDLTFWNDAEAMIRADDTSGDVLKSVPTGFPFKTTPVSPADTLLKNKAIYVYAGLTLGNRSPLHPRVDRVTWSSTSTGGIGARMVIGERQGWHAWGLPIGDPDKTPTEDDLKKIDHTVDRFTGVGIHVHEWGHLFGLVHPNGQWTGDNPHTGETSLPFTRANIMGWGAMQDGRQGPFIAGQQSNGTPSNYRLPYGSCPNPYNPFYRMDLGWNSVETITSSQNDKKIRPGPAQIYVVPSVNDQDYLLDFRDVSDTRTGNFGHYAAYKELSSSGLLIWRRESLTNNSNPMLIPADGRSIFDARDTRYSTDKPDYMHNDLPSDPFGAAVTEATSILEAHFTEDDSIAITNRDNGGANPPFGTTINPSYLAFRNITITSDSEGAYAEVDIRFIPLPPTSLSITAAPTEEDPNAVTLSWNAPDPNGADPILGYQYSTDGGTTWHPSLGAMLITSSPATITGLTATDLTFEMRTVTAHPNSAEGIGPDPDIDNLSPASDPIVLDRPGVVSLASSRDIASPTVGDVLTATLTDPNVPNSDDISISWQWQRKNINDPIWDETDNIEEENPDEEYTLTAEDQGNHLRVTATYDDMEGAEDMAESRQVELNFTGPKAAGDPMPSEDESTDSAATSPVDVGIYTNTDPNPNQPVWSLIGADADQFNLVQKTDNADAERTLQFKEPPNYEVPLEGGGYKTTYAIGVVVQDTPVGGAAGANGALSDTLLVTVEVLNVEETGSVRLAPLPPEVGTATVATLSDPDEGIVFTGARWTWQRRAGDTAGWEAVPAAARGTTDDY